MNSPFNNLTDIDTEDYNHHYKQRDEFTFVTPFVDNLFVDGNNFEETGTYESEFDK